MLHVVFLGVLSKLYVVFCKTSQEFVPFFLDLFRSWTTLCKMFFHLSLSLSLFLSLSLSFSLSFSLCFLSAAVAGWGGEGVGAGVSVSDRPAKRSRPYPPPPLRPPPLPAMGRLFSWDGVAVSLLETLRSLIGGGRGWEGVLFGRFLPPFSLVPPYIGNGPTTVLQSTVSNAELSEFFGLTEFRPARQ